MTPEEIDHANEQLIRSYRLCFGTPAGQDVLLDLMAFCRFRRPIESPIDEGKRQAFLRILEFVALTPEQLLALYGGRKMLKGEDTDE